MTHSSSSRDEADLAYLKRLAEAGRGQPAPFLLLIAVFGGAYGFALLAILTAFIIEGLPQPGTPVTGPISNFMGSWVIIGSHLVFFATVAWTIWRTLGPNRVRLSRSATATWSASLIALVATFVIFHLVTRNEAAPDATKIAQVIWPVVLILWGAAWWTTPSPATGDGSSPLRSEVLAQPLPWHGSAQRLWPLWLSWAPV